MATVVSSAADYIEEHHKKLHKLLTNFSVNVDRTPLVLVPSDTELAKIEAKVAKIVAKSGETMCEELRSISTGLSVIAINQYVDSSYTGGETTNKAEQLVKISKVEKGCFEVKSGPDFKTVAKCKLEKVVGAPFHSRDECRQVSIAMITDGEVATDGNKQERRKRGVLRGAGCGCVGACICGGVDRCRCPGNCTCKGRFSGGALQEAVSPDSVLELKRALLEDLITTTEYSKKNYFAPTIAGLVKRLSMNEAQFADDIKIFCMFYTRGCFAGAFYSMIIPHGSHSMLTDAFMKKWMGAPYYPKHSSILAYIDSFVARHSTFGPAIAEYKSKYSHGFRFDSVTTATGIKPMYAGMKSVFGVDISGQRMWADNINFRVHRILASHNFNSLRVLADSCCGKNYVSECEVANPRKHENPFIEADRPSEFVGNWFLSGTPEPLQVPAISNYMKSVLELNCE
jgi:hypothetical protein